MNIVAEEEIRFAGTVIEVDGEVVAKVTSFTRTFDVQEEDVTGAEDVMEGSLILHTKFIPVSVGETVNLAGIAIEGDAGQSALREAAENGTKVVLKQIRPTGYGLQMTGYFTGYEESGANASVYKFSGTFRVNEREDILGS